MLSLANFKFYIITILLNFYKHINTFSICQILSADYILDDLSTNIIKPIILVYILHTTNNIISIIFYNTQGRAKELLP